METLILHLRLTGHDVGSYVISSLQLQTQNYDWTMEEMGHF